MNNNKSLFDKVVGVATIIAAICTFLGISIFGSKSLFKDTETSNNSSNNENDEIEDDGMDLDINGDNNFTIIGNVSGNINIENGTSSESTISPETTALEIEIEPQFNFGQAMQHIYNNEEILQEEIINNKESKPVHSSIYPGVSYWHISNKVRLITVSNDFRDKKCSRTYYFDEEDKLTFALIKDKIGEHRLYFYDDILIRYIDENGKNYDIEQDLDDYKCEWTNLALEESYEIFNGVKKSTETDDFSVIASYNMNTIQNSFEGIDVLIKAETTFPADYVTISGVSDNAELETTNMHGGESEWYFKANFYIKGTYTIIITAYSSNGESVSDVFTYTY